MRRTASKNPNETGKNRRYVMARILILQEAPAPLQALRKSLGSHHELIFAASSSEATNILQSTQVDLIISRVHLERSSVFEFIKTVKENTQLSDIPFICFCGKRTEAAKTLDHVLAKAAEVMGADKYLVLDHFCADQDCDLDRLRTEIEGCLSKTPDT